MNRHTFVAITAIVVGVVASVLQARAAYDMNGTVERNSLYVTRFASGDTALFADSSRNLHVAVASGTITAAGGATGSVGSTSGTYALGRTNSGVAQYLNMDLAGNLLVTLQASSSQIGKLAANSGVDIGDVDVTSIAAGDNNIGNVDLASAIPTGANVIGAVTQSAGPWTVIGAATGSVAAVNGLGILARTAAGVFQWLRLGTDDALRIDPTGTTTQPVSGTVTANAGTGTFSVIGTSTGSVAAGNGLLITGRDAAGNAQPLRMATDGTLRFDPTGTTTQPVSGTFWQATQPVSGTVTANIGASASQPIYVTQVGSDGQGNPEDCSTVTVANVNVTTVATQLLAASPTKLISATFTSMDGEPRFGPSGVTALTGTPLAASASMAVKMRLSTGWYAIVAAGTSNVRVLSCASAN